VKQLATTDAKDALSMREPVTGDWFPKKPRRGKRPTPKATQLYTKFTSDELVRVTNSLVGLGLRWSADLGRYYCNKSAPGNAVFRREVIDAVVSDMREARLREADSADRGCCRGGPKGGGGDVNVHVDEDDDTAAEARTKEKLKVELFRVVLQIGQVAKEATLFERAKGSEANTVDEWARVCKDLGEGEVARNVAALEDELERRALDNEVEYAKNLFKLAKAYSEDDTYPQAGALLKCVLEELGAKLGTKFNLPRDLELKCADQLAKVAQAYVVNCVRPAPRATHPAHPAHASLADFFAVARFRIFALTAGAPVCKPLIVR